MDNKDFWKALEKVGRIVAAVSEILGEKQIGKIILVYI